MTKIARTYFDVQMTDASATGGIKLHRVAIMMTDQLTAEAELVGGNVNPAHVPMTLAACIAWAAMAREGLTDLPFGEFSRACVDVTRSAVEVEVDPFPQATPDDSA